MTNYNEILTTATKNGTLTLDTIKNIVSNYNSNITDNVDCILNETTFKKALETVNNYYKMVFINGFISALENDRATAFKSLIATPSYKKVVYKLNDNGTYTIDENKTTVFKFADIEKSFQLAKSTETDKNGNKIANKSVTVFGALRFYGLTNAFIRNMFIGNITVDGEKLVDISRVKVDGEALFVDDNGKTFASGSNNALEKQLNILVKFFGLDVKMLKKDLPILKLSAQKIKTDKANKSAIREVDVLKFVDVMFSVITSRYNNEDVKVIDNEGNEIKKAETETATE